MPKEELIILSKVDGSQFSENFRIVCLCFQLFVDGIGNLLLQLNFSVVVATRVICRKKIRYSLLQTILLIIEERDFTLIFLVFLFVCQFTQIHTHKTLDKRIALHNLIVKVRQWRWCFFINYDREPKTQTGNINSTFLYIHTIDIILDNALLNFSSVVMLATQHLTAMQQLVEQAHRECSRTDCRVTNLHFFKCSEKFRFLILRYICNTFFWRKNELANLIFCYTCIGFEVRNK